MARIATPWQNAVMANRPAHPDRARKGLRWHHALLAAVAMIGVVALVANLFGA